uniref:Integrase catalytic domain-containing protein n=1 Tax=Ditylenchus dipsaci TaxID=166011 RepID=A0A915DRJ6_9BILA
MGLTRVQTRLQNSFLPQETIQPIFLPQNHPVTELIVSQTHKMLLHGGPVLTLSHIRKYYWLPKGRKAVAQIIRKWCIPCRKLSATPFALPKYAPFPSSRVKPNPPFSNTGVDYFGPINLKEGGSPKKFWVALFTCLSVRAIHLEIVSDLSADKFLNAFKRFIARRGTPQRLLSDNATCFKLSKKVVTEMWDLKWASVLSSPEVLSYCAEHQIEWDFIVEHAPWKGGAWERLIKEVGEVVLVHQEETPRGLWRYAVITALLENQNKEISVAEIRYANGRITRRSVGLLFPLEITEEFNARVDPLQQETPPADQKFPKTGPSQEKRVLRDRKTIRPPARYAQFKDFDVDA